MQAHTFDAVVIGAGSGGLTTAVGLTKVGKKVLLVEREHIGGECTNSGCIPSKALLHHAKQYALAAKISGLTEKNEQYRQKAFSYVATKIQEILADETADHFAKLGITVVMGEAVFTGKRVIRVGETTYHFKKAIIATGSSPRQLPIEGLHTDRILTNQNLFSQTEIPARTLIIGAGPIGMEMGQALALLGSQVTLINNHSRFAKLEDEAVSSIITKIFLDIGITILNNAEVKKVTGQNALIELKNETGAVLKTEVVTFDKVLIAVGRVANIPRGLDTVGVKTTPFGITIDGNWRTTNKDIYALGDVSARMKFTHVADDIGRQVVTHIASKGLISVKEKAIPKVTYTEPEIAQVGLSWEEAQEQYSEKSVRRIEVSFAANDRARTDDDTSGLLIIIAKRLSGTILGAHIVGPRAGELISTLTLAMENNISLYRLRSTIFAYPTYSLILKKAGDYFLATQIASLKEDLLNLGKKAAPKICAASIWIGALLWLYQVKVVSGLSFSEIALSLFTFITSTAWGPLLYILAYTIRPLTFFPGTALTILSGVFFGLWGILYTIIGANFSATLAYTVGRFFSTNTKNTGLLKGSIELLQKNPFMAILTMRLTFFPYDVVNYGAGLVRVPFTPFILATIVGTLLGIATFVAIGAAISVEEFIKNGITADAIDTRFIIFSVIIFIASHVAAKLPKKV